VFEIGEIACCRIPFGMQRICRSKQSPEQGACPHSPLCPSFLRARTRGGCGGRPPWKVRLGRCRNHKYRLALDLDIVVTEFEPPGSEFSVPCHLNGFDEPFL